MRTYETLSQAISDLKMRDYTYDFNLHPDCIECRVLESHYQPEEFMVDEVYRFEGMTNPSDSAVLYAITAPNNIKGLLVDAYGTYSDPMNEEMIRKLRIVH